MSEVREFTGKDVDEAINKACDFFNAKRDRLEIEIQRGGSTGIFGLVGVKKAVVRARVRDRIPMDDPLKTRSGPGKDAMAAATQQRHPAPKSPKNLRPDSVEVDEETKKLVETVVRKLLTPIIGEPNLRLETEPGRVKIRVDDEENSGLVIGREGQTIAALQYLANRIVARKIDTQIRVHLDAGDYRQRQDENLRKTALFLADKARAQGRTQSTRPLSSYHRRVVHLALQNYEDVQTKSKGDGPLKRVLIFPRPDRADRLS